MPKKNWGSGARRQRLGTGEYFGTKKTIATEAVRIRTGVDPVRKLGPTELKIPGYNAPETAESKAREEKSFQARQAERNRNQEKIKADARKQVAKATSMSGVERLDKLPTDAREIKIAGYNDKKFDAIREDPRKAPFPSGKTPGQKAQGPLAGLFPEEQIRRIKGWDLADAKAAHKDYLNRAKDYAAENQPDVAKMWQRKADLIAAARPAVTRVTAAEARVNRQVERMVNRGVMSSEKKFDAITDQERNYQRATGKRMPVNFKAAAEFGAAGVVHGDMDKNPEINAARKSAKKLDAARWDPTDSNRQAEDPEGPQYSNAKYEHHGVGGETQFTNRGGSGSPGGGKGRGNWGHKGRPGKRGGSA